MKKLLMWFVLLNKRLYKKITYVGILLLIPVLVFLFTLSAKDSGSVVNVILAQEDPEDPFSSRVIEQLEQDSLVIGFRQASIEEAIALVGAGKADAAWIFPADLAMCLRDYIYKEKDSEGFIRIVEREQTVPLRLSRESLGAVLHSEAVKITYLKLIREAAPETQQMEEQALLEYLDKTDVTGELFAFYDIHGNRREESGNFLTTPIRGLLAVLAVISALVTVMYYQSDLDRGIFSLLPERHRVFGEFGYQMISSANILIFVIVALAAAGLCVDLGTELLIFLLYSICCSLFGMVIRAVFGGRRGVAVLIPVLTIVMLAVCPVFFDIGNLRQLQLLLPPTYFVNCAYNSRYMVYLIVYDVALLVVYTVLTFLKKQARKRTFGKA